jgi:hypothetical protein
MLLKMGIDLTLHMSQGERKQRPTTPTTYEDQGNASINVQRLVFSKLTAQTWAEPTRSRPVSCAAVVVALVVTSSKLLPPHGGAPEYNSELEEIYGIRLSCL